MLLPEYPDDLLLFLSVLTCVFSLLVAFQKRKKHFHFDFTLRYSSLAYTLPVSGLVFGACLAGSLPKYIS